MRNISFNSQRDGILLGWDLMAQFGRICFNSQRDGILPRSFYFACFKFTLVSIPNGMEFYLARRPYLCLPCQFQFPTGWNSTRSCNTHSLCKGVSIPNGMEFYALSGISSFCIVCFNSQRDGILLRNCKRHRKKWCVSIPNGMEFYRTPGNKRHKAQQRFKSQLDGILLFLDIQRLCNNCFNSQRDGILPSKKRCKTARRKCFNSQRDGILRQSFDFTSYRQKFQFPTGWNSTLAGFVLRKVVFRFQFPTGWNSTRAGWVYVYAHRRGFNSQRDGILLCLNIEVASFRLFQFPTGWNSTQACAAGIGRRVLVSIPNGMEFYFYQSSWKYFNI